MPDMGHVIALANHLKRAHREYRLMVASGFDRSRAVHEELHRNADASAPKLDETGLQAASVWLDFLDSIEEAEIMDDEQERMENDDN